MISRYNTCRVESVFLSTRQQCLLQISAQIYRNRDSSLSSAKFINEREAFFSMKARWPKYARIPKGIFLHILCTQCWLPVGFYEAITATPPLTRKHADMLRNAFTMSAQRKIKKAENPSRLCFRSSPFFILSHPKVL